MPQLRNLRIINAQFNEGKNIYEDFRMPFYGYNATFELVNGGGKSVLLMLLMQCILPKSALTNERPFKDMFHGGDQNRTTHVLAEWELDESISGKKKFLLTGFCAKRKIAQEEDSRNDDIQWFNYLYNYDKSNGLGINDIPLCSYENKAFVVKDFSKTFAMLKEKSSEYDIRITEKKREYQDWLKVYCLLESEWNIIREINERENHLKTHFARYKTSRALVEGLLIKTIEECLKDREHLNYEEKFDESSAIADALFKSQESLKRLQEEQDTLIHYEKLLSEVDNLSKTNQRLINVFESYRQEKNIAAAQFNAYELAIQKNEGEINDIIENLKNTELLLVNLKNTIEKINLNIINVQVNQAKKLKDQYENEMIPIKNEIVDKNYYLNFSKAVNKYLLIKENKSQISENEKILINKKESQKDLFDRINPLGKVLFDRLSIEISLLKERKKSEGNNLNDINARIRLGLKEIGGKQTQIDLNNKNLERIESAIAKITHEYEELIRQQKTYPQIFGCLFTEDKIEEVTKYLARLKQEQQDLFETINSLKEQINQEKLNENEINHQIISETELIERSKKELAEFQQNKERIQKILAVYEKETPESCLSHIECEIRKFNVNLMDQKSKVNLTNQQLISIQQYGFSLDGAFIKCLRAMKDRYPQSVSGAEYLKGLPENKRSEILNLAPWLPKAILVLDHQFKEIIRAPDNLPVEIQDVAPIISSLDIVRQNRPVTLGDIFIPHRKIDFLRDVFAGDKTIVRIKKELVREEETLKNIESSIHNFEQDQLTIRSFIDRYPSDRGTEIAIEISKLTDSLTVHKEKIREISKQTQSEVENLKIKQADFVKNIDRKEVSEKNLSILHEIKKNEDEQAKLHDEQNTIVAEQKNQIISLRVLEQENLKSQTEAEKRNESLRQTNGLLEKFQIEIRDYQQYSEKEPCITLKGDINEIRSEYRAVKKVIDGVENSVSQIEATIASDRVLIEGYKKDIHDLNISYEDLVAKNPDTPNSDEFLQQLQERINDLNKTQNALNDLLNAANLDYQIRDHEFSQKIKQYQKITTEEYTPNFAIFDADHFSDELSELTKQVIHVEGQIDTLQKDKERKEHAQKTVQDGFIEIRLLDATHHFKNSMCTAADHLIEYNTLKLELDRCDKIVRKNKNQYVVAKDTAIQNVSNIPIATEFKDIIKFRLKESESLQDAESNQQQLNNFSQIIHEKIGLHNKTIDALKEVEAKIVNQALGMARIYRDHLKIFPQLSKLDIDGKTSEMIRINFDECIFPDERANIEMRRYIQDINKGIRDGTTTRQELQKAFRPDQLVARVMEMGKIQVKIRKIEEGSQGFQRWDSIKASDGQENTMFIIFLIALMSYIRYIVVGRYDTNTSKVILLDNPFGSTSAYYLWVPIWSILKRNNIQLICSGHKIPSKILEFFPVHHLLSDDISKSGLRRVNIKVEASGKAKEIIDRNQPKDILQWTAGTI
jgi:hypothetical protein